MGISKKILHRERTNEGITKKTPLLNHIHPPKMSLSQHSLLSHYFDLQLLERIDRNMLNEGVEFFLCVIVFIPTTRHAHSHATRQIPNSLTPNEFVQFLIDAHVGCAHSLQSTFADGSDSTRSAFLELRIVNCLSNMDRHVQCFRL